MIENSEEPRDDVGDGEQALQMPESADGFVKTLNNTGYMTTGLDRFSRAFVQFSATALAPVLDVGAAYGIATLAALEAGASNVIANDIDARHLQLLADRVQETHRPRLRLLQGQFPEIELQAESLGAALVCRVLHFFDGETIERSASRLYEWIAPNGKVFVVTETPFVGTLKLFTQEYIKRKNDGELWPGLITNMQDYTPRAAALPGLGNWLDVDVLTRVFTAAGFAVEECSYFARPEFPDWLQLDGRESVGLVASKPACS